MARIIGIDFGLKRCGIAVTDPLQIIVSGLDTIDPKSLLEFLSNYFVKEKVEMIVLGWPKHVDGTDTELTVSINEFAHKFKQAYPEILVNFSDEKNTSKDATRIILQSGTPKLKRRDKALVDKVSAVLILQKYLGHI